MKNLIKIVSVACIGIFATSTATAQNNSDTEEMLLKKEKKEMEMRKQADRKAARKALRELRGSEVSDLSKANFASDFDGVLDVSWRRSANFDEATFMKDGVQTTAYYDYDSKLVGTTSEKTVNDLPGSALADINKHYKNYQIKKVIMFDDNEFNEMDMLLYGTQFESADNYFVEVSNGVRDVVLMVSMDGNVSYFATM